MPRLTLGYAPRYTFETEEQRRARDIRKLDEERKRREEEQRNRLQANQVQFDSLHSQITPVDQRQTELAKFDGMAPKRMAPSMRLDVEEEKRKFDAQKPQVTMYKDLPRLMAASWEGQMPEQSQENIVRELLATGLLKHGPSYGGQPELMRSVLPEKALAGIERIPYAGPSARRAIEPVTSPLGLAATALWPGMTAGMVAGEIGAGTVARAAGAPPLVQTGAELAGALVGGGVIGAGRVLVRKPGILARETEALALGERGGMPRVATETPAEAGNTFVAPLRNLDEITPEVVTSKSRVVRALVGRTSINPALLRNTRTGQLLTALERQQVAGKELTDTALSAALDAEAQKVTGFLPLTLDVRGNIKNIKVAPGQSRFWNDVFSRYETYNLKPVQVRYIRNAIQTVEETEAMRVAAGLPPRALKDQPWHYLPRQVEEIKGIDPRRLSDPNLRRVYEEAQEGIANGIKYNADPRATLELHLRSAYREVALKQFNDAITEIAVKPSALMQAKNPQLYARAQRVAQNLTSALRARRALVISRSVEALGPTEARILRGKMASARRAADIAVQEAQAEFNAVKEPYRRAMQAARKATVGPGNLFGQADETIAIGQWRNKFLPREDADLLAERLGSFGVSAQRTNVFSQTFNTTGNTIRFLSSVGDFAEPFIQGLPTLARNPVVWARATKNHYQAFFDPTVQARFIREHLQTFQKAAQHGTPIGDPEFFAAMQRGQGFSPGALLKLLPKGEEARALLQRGGRQTFGRFQSSYNAGLGANRALLYEGMRSSWKGSEAELWAYIRNMTGGLNSRALGVGPAQAGIESMWLAFSPRLLRSTIALVADLRKGVLDPRGRESWRSLGQLVAGATGLYVTTGLSLGKDWDEIGEGLNPLNGRKFLSHEINGDWVGIGGQVRALVQAMAYAGKAASEGDPTVFTSVDLYENPLLRAWYFRGAPGMNVAGGFVEAGTGEDVLPFDEVDSLPDLLQHLGTSALPFSVQGKLEGSQWTSIPFEITGMRTTPLTPRDVVERAPEGGVLPALEKAAGSAERKLSAIPRFRDMENKRYYEILDFLDDLERFREEEKLRYGVQEKPPVDVSIKEKARREGKDETFAKQALVINASGSKQYLAAINPDWLEFIYQHQDQLPFELVTVDYIQDYINWRKTHARPE